MSVLIIAEAGVNHNGSLDLALKMVDEAKRAGADIVKFQTAIPENVISKYADKAEYQKKTTGNEESQLEMCKRIHLKLSDYDIIKKYCEEAGIEFLSTPFDLESIDYLEKLGMKLWKIPSGEITNLPYLIKIAKTGRPVIMSTGMAELKEVEEAVNVLKENGAGEITLLHCTTEYPAPFESVNLRAMNTLREKFGTEVGYSDHTVGFEAAVAAVVLDASVIEKHFTLNHNMEGPDHKASLEPEEFEVMVNNIRLIEKALGDGVKQPAEAEKKNIAIARKSIVAARDIKKGEIFTEDNITVKRPGSGISPMKWFEVLGTEAVRDFGEDELIELS
ncbi:N-acetylneuraminate synthase [Catonella morbi ATCC 51271]|uniref:N-acetylneuraminate synthase n=1 Tax=Catonella morbi ATCC 51271 TaxID=592026 RepID=V2XHN1_9FIRM|nr:N-acetylneuraminate synthase [Catonella morbi]ESL01649.1 N-acetylneuraminate synthase [Catonella morbi ATCC 51271]